MSVQRIVTSRAVKVCAQADLCAAQYALYRTSEDEQNPTKKAALERIILALHDITNWTNVTAIGSDMILGNGDA